MLTKKQRDAIRARCEAATTGPWDVKTNRHFTVDRRAQGWVDGPNATCHWIGEKSRAYYDAVFIAHARRDIPALLEALEEEHARAARTCRAVYVMMGHFHKCSECGAELYIWANFCPGCGAQIERCSP